MVMAAAGAGTALISVGHLGAPGNGLPPVSPFVIWVALAGALAVPATAALAGRTWDRGGLWRGIALIAFAFWAPIVAGSLILPGFGTMFAHLALVSAVAAHPGLVALWLAALVVVLIPRRGRSSSRERAA